MGASGWYEIHAALMPGVTAQEPSRSEPDTPDATVSFDGFDGVFGATGVKTAVVPQKGADDDLIGVNKPGK
jgi:hypothetical protein